MEAKKFNIYSKGILILKENTLINIKRSLKSNLVFLKEISELNRDEILFFKDPDSGRSWEYERVI